MAQNPDFVSLAVKLGSLYCASSALNSQIPTGMPFDVAAGETTLRNLALTDMRSYVRTWRSKEQGFDLHCAA